MKARILVALLLGIVIEVCVWLGFWQLGRWRTKLEANERLRTALAAAPLDVTRDLPRDSIFGRRLRLRGRFDPAEIVLLRGRARGEANGVEVASPWRLAGDSTVVMVVRGWMPAADAVTVPAAAIPVDTSDGAIGLAEEFVSRPARVGLRVLEPGPPRVWTASRLDRDSLAFPGGRVAGWWVRALPAPDAAGSAGPSGPRPAPPAPANAGMHLGYAIQWFLLAALVAIGGIALLLRRRRAARAA